MTSHSPPTEAEMQAARELVESLESATRNYVGMARKYRHRGMLADSRAMIRMALAANADLIDAHFALGQLYAEATHV